MLRTDLFEIYNQKHIQNLIEKLNNQENIGKKLKYGYRVKLSNQENIYSRELNKLYSSVIWGIEDSAANNSLCFDEINALDEFFKDSTLRKVVFEVGCGSGRITRYLSKIAERLETADYDENVVKRFHINNPDLKNVTINTLDFSKKISSKKRYSSIILFENLIGMNTIEQDRIQIINNIENLLEINGVSLLAFRVDPTIKQGDFCYQAMDWITTLDGVNKTKIFGICLNWSIGYLVNLINSASKKLKIVSIDEGAERPAGGYMYYAKIQKIA